MENKVELEHTALKAYGEVLDAIDKAGQAFVPQENTDLDFFDEEKAEKRVAAIVRTLAGKSTKELGEGELFREEAFEKVKMARNSEDYQKTKKLVHQGQRLKLDDVALQNYRAINWLYRKLSSGDLPIVSARELITKK